ncbi:hypothetical protein [Streptomyces sp. NPDC050856]|uniref:hypothetical protein n=1 Tax=Streptomyces sp. NPDC050856 TaxID=3154939 RepID=UPI0033CFFEF0
MPWAAPVAAVVGLVWLYWAVGGTWGIARPAERHIEGHLLTGLGACWALAGSAAVRALARARPTRLPRQWLLALGWLGSGSLFAWSGWKLPLTLFVALTRPSDATPPENLAVAAVLHLAAVVAGIGMLRSLVGPVRPARVPEPPERAARRGRGVPGPAARRGPALRSPTGPDPAGPAAGCGPEAGEGGGPAQPVR